MIKEMSEWIVVKMVNNQVIEEMDAPVQRYGLELAFSFAITMLMLMVVAVVSNRTLEVIWAVLPFCILRGFSGGWHADTHLKCMSLFLGMVVLELTVMPTVVGELLMSNGMTITLALVTIISVFTFAPVESITKPLSEREKMTYKYSSRVVVVIILVANLLTYAYLSPMLGTIGIVSATLQALSLIPTVFNQESLSIKE